MNTSIFDNANYLRNPFPHCVVDNFFDIDIANKLHENISSLKLKDADSKFTNKQSLYECNKFAFSKINNFPLALKYIFIYLNSKEFITKLEKLTKISDIVCGDYCLRGAGVHMIKDEGFLAMHTDFNTYHHPTHGKLDRRINVLIYMNKDWKSEYKGDLLMYHPDNISEVKRIQPIFNRCVIFNTTDKSVHGHPEPLCVKNKDLCRKSIAVYYYTKNKNKNFDFQGNPEHSTIWHKNPNI
tara:strand:+ start:325 stop:1044 length:720 start_codon:yes stop_codon:yes gene_type:complete